MFCVLTELTSNGVNLFGFTPMKMCLWCVKSFIYKNVHGNSLQQDTMYYRSRTAGITKPICIANIFILLKTVRLGA